MDLLIDNYPCILSDHRLPEGSSIFCRNGATLILEEDAGPLQPLRFMIKGAQKSLTLNEIFSVKLPEDASLIPVLDKNVSFFPEFLYADKDFFKEIFKNSSYFFKDVETSKHTSEIKCSLKKACSGKVLSKSPYDHASNSIKDIKELDVVVSFEEELAQSMLKMCTFLEETIKDSEVLSHYYSNCLEDFYFLGWYKKLPKGILEEHSTLTEWYKLPGRVRHSLKDLVWIHFRSLLYLKDPAMPSLADFDPSHISDLDVSKKFNFSETSKFESSNFQNNTDSPLKRALYLSNHEKVKIYDQIIKGLISVTGKSSMSVNFNPYILFEMTNNIEFLSFSKDSDNMGLNLQDYRAEPTILKWGGLHIPLTESI